MIIGEKDLALDLFYRDEIRYCYLIRMADENRIARIIIDDSVSPHSFIVFEKTGGRQSLFMDSCHKVSLSNISKYFPQEEFYLEIYRQNLVEILNKLNLNYYYSGTSDRMYLPAQDFKPREFGKAIHYEPALHREFLKNSRIWDGIPNINMQKLIEYIETADSEWVVVEEGRVVSKCDVFKRSRNCYEMNEVVTEAGFRRRGFAAQIVSSAANWVIRQNKISLYSANSNNIPSINLAKSLGYKLAARITGFVVKPV